MEQVEEICDHIVLVNLGHKVLDGTVDQIKKDFKENKFHIQLSHLPDNIDCPAFEIIANTGNKLIVKIHEGYNSNKVLQYFIDKDIHIETFTEVLPSLNEIFIRLVEGTRATTRSFQKIEA